MKTLAICVAFYGLGVFNCAVFAAVYLLHRPRYVAPTKRRKYRDALPRTMHEPPPMPQVKPANIPVYEPYSLGKDRFICKHNCGNKIAIAGEPQAICTRVNGGFPCGMIVVNDEGEAAAEPMYMYGVTGEER